MAAHSADVQLETPAPVTPREPDGLAELLPRWHRLRDAEEGEPLRALLAVIAEQLDRVRDGVQQGYEDLFVASSMNAAFRYQPNLMLLNDAGQRFERTEYALGLEPRANGEAYKPWYSVDCTENPENAVCQGTGLTGVVDVWEAYGSRSSALVDLDKDGDLDVVTNDWNSEPQLLLSDLSERGGLNWIGVDLEGTSANRDGLGATVTVEVGGRILRQIADGQSGYMSQSATPLYFGLGSEQAADRIVVDWPGGTSQEVAGPHASGTVVAIGQEP